MDAGPNTCIFTVFFIIIYTKVLVIPSCPILCDPIDYTSPFSVTPWTIGPLGSSVHGILQTRILSIYSPGDKTNSGIEPESLELQADSFLSDPPGMPYSLFKL